LTLTARGFEVIRADAQKSSEVLAIVQDAAAWLASRRIPQWTHYATEAGVAHLRRRIEQEEVYLFLNATGQSIGTACVQWTDTQYWGDRGNDGHAGYIHQLAIRRSVGGQGVGSAILDWAISHIQAAGRSTVRLDCSSSNSVLCAYYERHGFVRSGTVTLGEFTGQLFERQF
jgi:ribosomal protein S18 acetylase RimI-like enzyme